jgi:hypothetical protein
VKKPTTEVIELFRDWLPYVNEAAKYGYADCSGKVGLASWNCCETHRRLKAQSVDLDKRAAAIGISDNATYSIFSPRWWKENGIPYNHADEHEPLEYFGFHSKEWDRNARLAAYAESLLRPELDALVKLRDAKGQTAVYMAVAGVPRGWHMLDDADKATVRLGAAGIARIREIEELLK